MPETPLEKMLRESREKRLTSAPVAPSTPAVPSNPVNPAWSKYASVYTETDTAEQPKSLEADKLQEIVRSLPIKRIFDEISHGKYKNDYARTRNSGEVSIHCPNPAHTDNNASASMNLDSGLWTCYTCNDSGTDKIVLAAYAWGFPVPIPTGDSTAWEIKKRLAKQLSGWDYDAEVEKARELKAAQAPLPPSAPGVASPDSAEEVTEDDLWSVHVERAARKKHIELEGFKLAKQRIAESEFVPPEIEVMSFAEEMLIPSPPIQWTIKDLHVIGGNTTITASQKSGKTTCMMNLVKSLADNEPFLGEFETRELNGNILFLNYEVNPEQFKRSLAAVGVRNPEKIFHLPLRGKTFDLMSDQAILWLASTYLIPFEIEVLVVDPFHGAFNLDENSNSDVSLWTKKLDQIKETYGILDSFIPVHTGRGDGVQRRARGATRIDDWADHRWILVKDDESNIREFEAIGRDVGVDPRAIEFEPSTRKMSLGTGSARQNVHKGYKKELLELIVNQPGITKTDVQTHFQADNNKPKRDAINKALDELLLDGDIVMRKVSTGKRGAQPMGYWEIAMAPSPNSTSISV